MNQTPFGPVLPPDVLNNYAWLGDAVLLLYARGRILREESTVDNAACVRMTSNQFLASVGEPTRVEAEIGRIYLDSGWTEAVRWIETWLMPLFAKQEENMQKAQSTRRHTKRGHHE